MTKADAELLKAERSEHSAGHEEREQRGTRGTVTGRRKEKKKKEGGVCIKQSVRGGKGQHQSVPGSHS